ncbi:hemerythrin family protein [bacterium]|nr:hemerythrin family protein [bacterium]
MYIKWSEDLSVGVELIDEQHKEMFNRINRLLRAIGEIGGAEQVVATADFLQEYVVKHFAAEEEQMVLHGYPGLASHKEHHEYFRGQVEDLRQRLAEHGPDEKLLIEAQELLVNYLRDHILQVDMLLGRFLKENL